MASSVTVLRKNTACRMNSRFGDVAIQIDLHLMKEAIDAPNCGEALQRQCEESSVKLSKEICTNRCRKKKKETYRSRNGYS